MDFIFTKDSEKQFLKLDSVVQLKIRKKIEKIKQWESYHLKLLVNMLPFTHRLRVDDYRLLLRQCDEWYEVLKVGHRWSVYK